jgi:hypothetical protein
MNVVRHWAIMHLGCMLVSAPANDESDRWAWSITLNLLWFGFHVRLTV